MWAKTSVSISCGSFGSAVDAKNKKLLLCALSLRSVYLVARLAVFDYRAKRATEYNHLQKWPCIL